MNGLVLVDDLALLTVFWELTTLCSLLLIAHDGTPIALESAGRALWMNVLGGVGLAAAAIALPLAGVAPSLKEIIARGANGGDILVLAVALLVFAGMTKAAQLPFQSWLLGAMVAPTPVSALLHSSTMVKAGVYMVVRLSPAFAGSALATVVIIAGALTFAATAILSLTQSDGKRVLAYSTICYLGLIIAAAGLATPGALAAATLLIAFHGMTKALLFLVVGSMDHAIGTRDLEALEGMFRRNASLGLVAAAGMLLMIAPAAGLLLAKWLAIESFAKSYWAFFMVVVLLLALGSAASVAVWAKWAGRIFASAPEVDQDGQPLRVRIPFASRFSFGALLALIVACSLAADPILGQIGERGLGIVKSADAASAIVSFPLGLLALIVLVALGLPVLITRWKPARIVPPYLGGDNVGGVTSSAFMTAGDGIDTARSAGGYWLELFGPKALGRWANVAAIVLLIALVGVSFA
jgi:ech hydrogenase subunit A